MRLSDILFFGVVCVLCSFLVAADSFGAYRWTYSSVQSGKGVFMTGYDIDLSFVSDKNGNTYDPQKVQWTVPSVCSESGTQTTDPVIVYGLKATINCAKAGSYAISLKVINKDDVDTFYVTIDEPPACYEWYLATLDENENPFTPTASQTTMLRIWIFNRRTAVESDLTTPQTRPSADAIKLSKSMHSLGESPVLKPVVASHISDITPFPEDFQFSHQGGYWFANYTPQYPNNINVEISGYNVGTFGCKTSPTYKNIYILSPSLKTIQNPKVTLSWPIGSWDSAVQRDSCSSNVAAVIIQDSKCPDKIMLTTDDFGSTQFIKMPSNIKCLLNVIPRRYGLFTLLDSTGKIYTTKDFISVNASTIQDSLSDIQANEACDSIYQSKNYLDSKNNHIIIGWNSIKPGAFYVSYDDGYSFVKINTVAGVKIYDISIQLSVPYFSMIVQFQSKYYLMQYNYETNELRDLKSSFPLQLTSTKVNPKVRTVVSSSAEAFVFGEKLLYSADGCFTAVEVLIRSRNPYAYPKGLDKDETIVDVQTSATGDFIVITSFNRLFYGTLSSRTLVEIQSGVPTNRAAYFMLDIQMNLIALVPENSGNKITMRTYIVPYTNEVMSPKAPLLFNAPTVCPYRNWLDDLQVATYDLDIGEYQQNTFSLLNNASYGLGFSFTTTRSELIGLDMTTTTNPSLSAIAVSTKLKIYPLVSVSQNVTYPRLTSSVGRTDVRVIPVNGDPTCLIQEKIIQVKAGCPIKTTLKTMGTSYDPSSCHGWDGSLLRSRVSQHSVNNPPMSFVNKESKYDVSLFGCPIRHYQGLPPFKFKIGLYKDDEFVERVPANFVAYEINGRTDFDYSKTENDVRCLVRQSGWEDRLSKSKIPDHLWTNQNHMNCFVSNSSLPSASSKPYEVMNSTLDNGIDFSYRDGLYIFQVRVVDPAYSYCDLYTYVAIEVYGNPPGVYVSLIVVGTVALIAVILMLISYQSYRKQKIE